MAGANLYTANSIPSRAKPDPPSRSGQREQPQLGRSGTWDTIQLINPAPHEALCLYQQRSSTGVKFTSLFWPDLSLRRDMQSLPAAVATKTLCCGDPSQPGTICAVGAAGLGSLPATNFRVLTACPECSGWKISSQGNTIPTNGGGSPKVPCHLLRTPLVSKRISPDYTVYLSALAYVQDYYPFGHRIPPCLRGPAQLLC